VALRLEAVTFDVADASAVATFWSELLGRDVVAEPGGALVPGDETQVGLRFVTSDTEQVGPPRLHLHLTSRNPDDQQRTVDTVLSLGGRHLDVGQEPDADFVVLADPGGNALCVIDPDNRFLAGTGRLGEVTCDGTRDVGLFWRDVLGWPLVWDENQETSIQSPLGGTKVSWGGPPVEPRRGRNRQRFDLVAADPAYEVERLLSLGATRRADLLDGVELADPDGNEFSLRAG
jgi:catechol 2,3-dioxygenase-like lactoylglutathione lyase family enzyme